MFAGFALSTLIGPMMNNAGLYWIAIEVTTLISTFLVAYEREATSIEAAWKYIIIVSAGISLALLGTILFYWSGTFVLGPTYDMTWDALRDIAPRLNPALVSLSFLLVLIGYGTKVGLAPMHTWLPDAHSEGSGAGVSPAVWRVAQYRHGRDRPLPRRRGRGRNLDFWRAARSSSLGGFSLFVAALFIVRQTGVKRLMAYSSVEHMGVIAIGFGFGGSLGIAGALYHMLNHSLNKSLMFFGAGSVMRAYGAKRISKIRLVGQRFPLVGALWLAGAVAITGAPPFGLFLSELAIIRAGLAGSHWLLVALIAILLIVIFIGFLNHFRSMYFDGVAREAGEKPRDQRMVHRPDGARASAGSCHGSMVAAASVGPFPCDRRLPLDCGAGRVKPMMGTRIKSVTAETLDGEARALREVGGRMQFAYAWSPNGDDIEVRYVAALPGRQDFEMWFLKSGNQVPSLAHIWPLLGWYEREMTDLSGIRFAGHPEPYPLVLRDGAPPPGNGHDFLEHPPMNGKHHLPIDRREGRPAAALRTHSRGCRRDPPNSRSSMSASTSSIISRRLFFKHRGMETRFEGCSPDHAVVMAERVSGVGTRRSCARLLRGGRTRRRLRCAGSRASASRTARGA